MRLQKTMISQETLDIISSKIKNARLSLVLSHQNPDGDTLGSMLSMGAILKETGHTVDHVVPDFIPKAYRFLPFCDLVKTPDDKSLSKNYDLAVSLDCGSVKRLGKTEKLWSDAKTRINIDHHISNENFGDINCIEADATSTGQVVYWLAKGLNIPITPAVATLLYTTLLTDTGCFSNSNTNSQALQWGAELINLGAEHLKVYREVFMKKPYRAVKVFATSLADLNLIHDGKIAWTYLSSESLKKYGATAEDTDDIIDFVMRTEGVEVGIFFREDESETKVSLRSKSEFDVSKIAVANGGGGHKRAAGINIKSPFLEVKDLILNQVVEEYKKAR